MGSALTQAIVAEELSWGCIGVYSYFSGTNMFIAAISECGTDDQRRRWLAPLCADGPHTAGFACTEPGGGSDVSRIRTKARRVDGGFVLNGQKIFITNAGLAQSLLIVADAIDGDQRFGLTMFAVRGDAPGLSYGPRARTMGWRASTNAEVFIDDLFVPDDDVIGEVGTGLRRRRANVRTEPHRGRRVLDRRCPRRARIRPRLCQPARSVRSAHRPIPRRQLPVGRRR